MAMPPVCFCNDGGPAVAMRCLKNGVSLAHVSEASLPKKKQYNGDAWKCPYCGNVIVLCSDGVSDKSVLTEDVDDDTCWVASVSGEIKDLKEVYVRPPWIGGSHG